MAENKRGKISQLPYLEGIEGGESLLGAADGKGFQVTIDALKQYMGGSGGGSSVDLTNVKTNIIPTNNDKQSLGSSEKRWGVLHVGSVQLGTNVDTAIRIGTELDRVELSAHLRTYSSQGKLSSVMTQDDMSQYALSNDIPKDYATDSELTQAITNLKGGASTGYDTLMKIEAKVKANAQAIANKPSETYTFGAGLEVESGKVSVKIDPLSELQFGSGLYPLHFGENGGLTIKLGDGLGWNSNGEIVNTRETNIEDNLTSNSATSALSANQGKVLKGLIDSVDTTATNAASTATTALSKANANEASIAALGVNNTTLANKINEVDGVAKQNKTDIATLNNTTKSLQGSINDLNVFKGSALSDLETLMKFYQDTDNDEIINKWQELEKVLKGLTESDNLAEILSGKADKSTVYTKTDVDAMLGSYATASSVTELTAGVQMVQQDLLLKIGGKADKSYVDSNFVSNDRASNFAEYGQFLNINNGTITINGDTIKPLTSHQTLYSLTLKDSAGNQIFAYDPKTELSGVGYVYQLTKANVGLGNVENTALSSWKGTANITTLGTITSGTWNGTKIGQSYLDLSGYAKSSDLGSLAKKNSLAVSDIPDLSGTYQTKITSTNKLSSSLVSGLGAASGYGVSQGNFTSSDQNLVVGAAVYAHVTNRLDGYATQSWVEGKNYLTGITSAQVTGALGYTPTSITENDLINKGFVLSTALAGYLPLSGGILNSGTNIPLTIQSPSTGAYSMIDYYIGTGRMGSMGFSKENTPSVRYTDGTFHTLIHSGNIGSQTVAKSNALVNSDGAVVLQGNMFMRSLVRYTPADVGDAVGLKYRTSVGTSLCGIGAYVLKDVLQGMYLGWGDSPWEPANSFRVSEDSITYKGHGIIHAGNIGSQSVDKANKLSAARTIWGQSFDGSGNVSGDLSGVGSITRSFQYAVDSDVAGNLKFKRNDSTWSIISSSGSYYLTVTASSGNVGVGTTNPNAKLHVNGSARFDGVININGKDIAYSNGVDTAYFGNENLPAFISGTSVNLRYGTTTGLILNSSGNVGIGTPNPVRKLHINDTSGIPAILQSNQPSTALGFSQKDDGVAYLVYSGGANWKITNRNWNAEYNLIHSGNYEEYTVHKNTFEGALTRLTQVENMAGNNQSSLEDAWFDINILNANKSNWNTAYANWTNGVSSFKTDRIICKSDNDFSIAIGSIQLSSDMAGYSMYPMISSNLYMSLGAEDYSFYQVYAYTYNNTSDATKKNILGDVNLSVNSIANAPAKVFTWKDNPDTRRKVGTIAQYWRDVLPEVVSGKEGSMSMNYAELAVVSSIILARNVETHEQRIQRLEREISNLQNELDELRKNSE